MQVNDEIEKRDFVAANKFSALAKKYSLISIGFGILFGSLIAANYFFNMNS